MAPTRPLAVIGLVATAVAWPWTSAIVEIAVAGISSVVGTAIVAIGITIRTGWWT